MIEKYRIEEFDGIIIGCGGAGSRAAIEAFDKGARVAMVSKCRLGKAHTVMAEGGMATAMGKNDSPEKHFADTLIGGVGLNDWKKVWEMVKGGKDVISYLERHGAIFDRNEEGYVEPRAFGGHSEKRVCHVSDRTGHAIIHTLKNEMLRRDIPFFEKTIVTSILTDNGRVAGATAIDIADGEFVLFKVRFAIIATGGCGTIYRYTTNSKDVTGDGVYLAYEAGAEIMDMEMIQFHPTCMVEPEEKRGILVTEACRGEGGVLINSRGERFMATAKNTDGTPKYAGRLGHPELEPRDIVSRALEEQYDKGLGPVKLIVCREAWKNEAGKMCIPPEYQRLVEPARLLDADGVKKKLSSMHEQFEKFAHVDITKEGMVVRPGNHYMMGGIRTDAETCETSVRGLYAAGEVGSGIHGANRLGGNSLTDIQVEGIISGRAAAGYAARTSHAEVREEAAQREWSRLLSLLGNGIRHSEIQEELKDSMWRHVGMKRDEKGLAKALETIERLKGNAKGMKAPGGREGNTAWQEAIETLGMLTVAEMIVMSALERRESRGAHCRLDYPQKDKGWLANIICSKEGDRMVLEKRPIEPMPEHLRRLLPEKWLKETYGG